MSGWQTDASDVARYQVHLMQTVIYDRSVSGQVKDPLEWFPFSMLGPPVRFLHV